MEIHNGFKRYTKNPEKCLTMEDYYAQYIPRQKEQLDHTYVDQAEEMSKELPKLVSDISENAVKDIQGDFFIEVIIKAERRYDGLFKHLAIARPSCPSPQYERIVYHYHRDTDELELLWIIPTLSRCIQCMENGQRDIKSDDRLLTEFVLQYANGNLDALEKKINSELRPPSNNSYRPIIIEG